MPDLDWFEGFETWALPDGTSNTQASARYTGGYNLGGGAANEISAGYGRLGSRGLRNDSSGGAISAWFERMHDKNGSALAFTEYVQQIYVYRNDATTASKRIMGVCESAGIVTPHLELWYAPAAAGVDANLTLYRDAGATLLATATAVIPYQTWTFVEIIGKIHDTTGYYHVRVNGVVVMTATGVDTRTGGTGVCGGHWFGNTNVTGAFETRYDDYAFSLNPSSSGDYLGDGHEVALIPSGAGNYQQFVPIVSTLVSNIDDAQPDEDTTYNYEANVGDRDTFAMGDLPTAPGVIHGVIGFVRARKDDSGTRTMKQSVRISSTDYDGSAFTLSDTYQTAIRCMPVSPASGIAWTEVELNAVEHGYKLHA